MYSLHCVVPGPAGDSMSNYRGTLMEVLRMAGRLYRRLGQVSRIERWDGSDLRRPAKRLPLP